MKFKTALDLPEVRAHSSLLNRSIFAKLIIDIRKFIYEDFNYRTRWDQLAQLYNLDPEVQGSIDLISSLIYGMYSGPALSILNVNQPESPDSQQARDFLEKVDSILDEIKFTQKLSTIVKLLMRDGNVVFRLYHGIDGHISDIELLPISTISILPADGEFNEGQTILERGLYIVNEDEGDGLYKLSPNDILHFSLNREGNLIQDKFGRWTYSVYGRSPLESLIFVAKKKMQAVLDYFRWSKVNVPRLEAILDVSEIGNPDNYSGSADQRIAKAQDAVEEVVKTVERSLYYRDDDSNSPTYGEYLPIEPDHLFIHSKQIELRRLEPRSIYPDVSATIQDCNRSISARLGIPLSALGYEEGSTYAIGRITRQFMYTIGYGLMRNLETDLIELFEKEFPRRNWTLEKSLISDFYLETEFRDPDQEEIEIEKSRINSDIALRGFQLGILSREEARKLLGFME